MLLPKTVRKFVAVFRGEVSPVLILLSVLFGFWFGLMPGWSGVHVALLVLALVLNIHIGLFALFAGLGRAICFAAAPVWFHVGRWAQDALQPVYEYVGGLPVLGLTDFAVYAIAGGFLAGPVLGLVLGLLLARSVHIFRRTWLKLEENSDRFRQWQSNRWVRWLDWLLLGKRTEDVRTVLRRRARIIRVPGVIVAVVLVAVSAVGLYFVQGDRLQMLASDALTQANGAEVNLAEFALAPLAGRISARGLAVTDPARPSINRLSADELTADASLWNLLRGKLVMDDVTMRSVSFDAPRSSPGLVLPREPQTAATPEFKPEALGIPIVGDEIAKLETYFRRAEDLRDWLAEIKPWLPQREPAPPAAPVPERYLEYLTARAAVPPAPRFIVRKAVLGGVRIELEEFGPSTITCSNLSDAPAAAGLPLIVEIQSEQRATTLRINCRYDREAGGAEIAGRIEDLDLKRLQQSLSPRNPIAFDGGTATTDIAGSATRQWIDLSLAIQTQGMRARAAAGVFGLDQRVTNEAVRVLEHVETRLRVVGPLLAPRLVFDPPQLTEQFKQALVKAGKAELARQVDDLLGDKVPGAGKLLDDPVGGAQEALSGLLGGQDKKKDAADEKKKDKKQDALDRLRRHLKPKPKPEKE
jgi:uncharacterized protein (TIGR03546 family)